MAAKKTNKQVEHYSSDTFYIIYNILLGEISSVLASRGDPSPFSWLYRNKLFCITGETPTPTLTSKVCGNPLPLYVHKHDDNQRNLILDVSCPSAGGSG